MKVLTPLTSPHLEAIAEVEIDETSGNDGKDNRLYIEVEGTRHEVILKVADNGVVYLSYYDTQGRKSTVPISRVG